MSQPYFHSFYLKAVDLRKFTGHTARIDISADGPHFGAHRPQTFDYTHISHIAGVPYLVTVLEVDGEAVVPAAVRV